MLTKDVLKHFRSRSAVTKALGLSRTAVWQWGDVVPKTSAYKLEILTRGKLRVNEAYYDGIRVAPKYQNKSKAVRHGAPA